MIFIIKLLKENRIKKIKAFFHFFFQDIKITVNQLREKISIQENFC